MKDTSEQDLGFSYKVSKGGELVIMHHDRVATKLRAKNANKHIARLETSPFAAQQILMAKLTGNYKRGNERPEKA